MKIVSLVSALASFASAEEYYNILAMDGGGIRGLIPAVLLSKLEEHAYEYATSKGYAIKTYPDALGGNRTKVVAMNDLFDMTAGTSTGSILAACLVYPLNTTKPGEP